MDSAISELENIAGSEPMIDLIISKIEKIIHSINYTIYDAEI